MSVIAVAPGVGVERWTTVGQIRLLLEKNLFFVPQGLLFVPEGVLVVNQFLQFVEMIRLGFVIQGLRT
jgi:hypothetical protein